jgi:hypothetical protein
MWKLLFLATRGWRYIPKRHRRAMMFAAAGTARRHGPAIARAAGRAYKGARKLP